MTGVRIGSTEHLTDDSKETLCGMRIAGTPFARQSDKRCLDCEAVASERADKVLGREGEVEE